MLNTSEYQLKARFATVPCAGLPEPIATSTNAWPENMRLRLQRKNAVVYTNSLAWVCYRVLLLAERPNCRLWLSYHFMSISKLPEYPLTSISVGIRSGLHVRLPTRVIHELIGETAERWFPTSESNAAEIRRDCATKKGIATA